jgi:hypothetical protein
VHDGIARWQQRRRLRQIQGQAVPHIPDGALSRAQPPGKPEASARSVSRADRRLP